MGQIGIGSGGCLHPISMPATAEVPESLDKDKDKGGGSKKKSVNMGILYTIYIYILYTIYIYILYTRISGRYAAFILAPTGGFGYAKDTGLSIIHVKS